MTGETQWNIIITKISSAGEELQTKTGLWFRISSCDGKLYVNRAIDNTPSCKLSMQRPISKIDFIFVYSYYDRWIDGEKDARQEVTTKSENSTYIFALIDRYI